jgi:hypothetical protein
MCLPKTGISGGLGKIVRRGNPSCLQEDGPDPLRTCHRRQLWTAIAVCSTSARGNSLSADLTDSDNRTRHLITGS